jgi:hypothetical protein
MKLHEARLCLDCDEVHQEGVCPVCGSESFAYISRWVPVPDEKRPARPSSTPQAEAYRELLAEEPAEPKRRGLRGGLLGLTALGLAGWAWRARTSGKKNPDGFRRS